MNDDGVARSRAAARLGFEQLALRALADDQQLGVRDEARTSGQASSRVGWPFSGSRRATTPTTGAPAGMPYSVVERAARLLLGVALEVDAVVDEVDRGADAALVIELADDRARDGDQAVHPRGEAAQELAILLGPDAARVDRADDERAGPTGRREGPRGLRAHDLGPVHVVVDDVGLDGGEVRRDGLDRRVVGHVVEDAHVHARALDAAHARAAREGEHARRRSGPGRRGSRC